MIFPQLHHLAHDLRLRRFFAEQEPDDEQLDEEQRLRARQNRFRLIAQMEEKGEDSEQAQIEAFYAMKNGK